MTGKERIKTVLDHKSADKIAVDFGATQVTGIHCKVVEGLRRHYGLEDHPVYIHEPGQMLALVEDDLAEAMGGVDAIGCFAPKNAIGLLNADWKPYTMPWGQTVMFPEKMTDSFTMKDGAIYTYPEGDRTLPPSGCMPERCYFFDSIERQQGEIDDENLNVEDNLMEFGEVGEETLKYWKEEVDKASTSGKAVIAGFGGMDLGNVGRLLSMAIREPRGIRSVAEWYMSTVCRQDYVREMFDRISALAVKNLEKIYAVVGEKVDIAYICGADFGTQDSQFCSVEMFDDLWVPYYKRVNDWIHKNTGWKTFKHSCGDVFPLMESFIKAGFDIMNPVQIAAADMDPQRLKDMFGDRVTFWGGGVDTQKVLPFGTPDEVRRQVMELCEIFGRDGGFVFNTVHNIQANVPLENVIAMVDALKEIRA